MDIYTLFTVNEHDLSNEQLLAAWDELGLRYTALDLMRERHEIDLPTFDARFAAYNRRFEQLAAETSRRNVSDSEIG